jgi:hypothetical protein
VRDRRRRGGGLGIRGVGDLIALINHLKGTQVLSPPESQTSG